jgi:hypothetical protein
MRLWNGIGIFGILLIILLIVIGIWFGIVTATLIATAVGATGLNWWIVAITIFGALGGCGGSLITIGRD